MENKDAARTLFGVAALLDAQGANPYRVRSFRRAARGLMRLSVQAVVAVRSHDSVVTNTSVPAHAA